MSTDKTQMVATELDAVKQRLKAMNLAKGEIKQTLRKLNRGIIIKVEANLSGDVPTYEKAKRLLDLLMFREIGWRGFSGTISRPAHRMFFAYETINGAFFTDAPGCKIHFSQAQVWQFRQQLLTELQQLERELQQHAVAV